MKGGGGQLHRQFGGRGWCSYYVGVWYILMKKRNAECLQILWIVSPSKMTATTCSTCILITDRSTIVTVAACTASDLSLSFRATDDVMTGHHTMPCLFRRYWVVTVDGIAHILDTFASVAATCSITFTEVLRAHFERCRATWNGDGSGSWCSPALSTRNCRAQQQNCRHCNENSWNELHL